MVIISLTSCGRLKDENGRHVVRVEPEKFAIQLAVTDERTGGVTPDQARAQALGYGERSNMAEKGMKQVIYLAFAGTKCGSQ
jgi:hypothetical protein